VRDLVNVVTKRC